MKQSIGSDTSVRSSNSIMYVRSSSDACVVYSTLGSLGRSSRGFWQPDIGFGHPTRVRVIFLAK